MAFNRLINQKNLYSEAFKPGEIKLTDDIRQHAAWAFNHIYNDPYPKSRSVNESKEDVARLIHGIQHVSRAALYIPILANLYRRHGDKEALNLTEDDIKLLQIAVLFHDAARENEGEDLWDRDSALLLFHYLTSVLEIPTEKAKLFAEAVANKDSEKEYYELIINDKNEPEWKLNSASIHVRHFDIDYMFDELVFGKSRISIAHTPRPKNIFQKLIHDADCLDILRARPHFDAEYLDFYKQFGKNNQAFEEMAKLITEARSLIETQGDSYLRIKKPIKKEYEHANAYSAQVDALRRCTHFRLMPRLHADGKLLNPDELKMQLLDTHEFDTTKPLTLENLRAGISQHKVLARSIPAPSATRLDKKNESKSERKSETLAEVEIRKAMRRPGIKTRTNKPNNMIKNGNPLRSASLIGSGGTVFGDAGFLIIADEKSIQKVDSKDAGTGHHKKEHLKNETIQSSLVLAHEFKQLKTQLKKGGNSVIFPRIGHPSTHTEVLYHIKEFHAVYFSQDPKLYNVDIFRDPYPFHPFSPALQAIYLQKTHEKQTGIKLPIFEYSGIHDVVKQFEYTDETIVQMYKKTCTDYLEKELKEINYAVFNISLDDLKTIALYSNCKNHYAKANAPVDTCFDEELRQVINREIEVERERLFNEFKKDVLHKIRNKQCSVLDGDVFYALLNYPMLSKIPEVQERIREDIEKELASNNLLDLLNHYASWTKISKLNSRESNQPMFRDHQEEWLFYRDRPCIRLYHLAINCEMHDIVSLITEKAKIKAQEKISKLAGISDLSEYTKHIEQLADFVMLYNINEEMKNDIQLAVIRFLKTPLELPPKSFLHWYYKDLFFLLKKIGLMNEACELLAKNHVNVLVSSMMPDFNLQDFLNLANAAGLNTEEKRQHLINVFSHPQIRIEQLSTYGFIGNLLETEGLLNDPFLFERYIQLAAKEVSKYSWKDFETYLQGKKLQEWQIKIVEQYKPIQPEPELKKPLKFERRTMLETPIFFFRSKGMEICKDVIIKKEFEKNELVKLIKLEQPKKLKFFKTPHTRSSREELEAQKRMGNANAQKEWDKQWGLIKL